MKRRGIISVVGIVATATAVMSAAPPATATPATVTVNCAHHSLTAALRHATSGATVLVSGHCTGSFTVFNKNLTIRGNPTATLDARHHGRVLDLAEGSITLRSLTITGGTLSNGAGIFAKGNVHLRLVHVTVTKNTSTFGEGAGIEAVVDSPVTLVHSAITHNTASDSAAPAGTTEMEVDGGGVFTDADSALTITDSVVSDNTAGAQASSQAVASGGGVYAQARLTVRGSRFSGNHAVGLNATMTHAEGGGVSWVPQGGSALLVAGTTFASNRATIASAKYVSGGGGAMYLAPAAGSHHATVTSTSMTGNAVSITGAAVDEAAGGAIDADGTNGSVALDLTSTSVTHSTVTAANGVPFASGGGIALNHASATVTRSTLAGNTARAVATRASNSTTNTATARGGAIDAESLSGPLRISTSTIARNTITGQSPDRDVQLSGGGVVTTGPFPLVMSQSTVSGNVAKVTAAGAASGAFGGGLDLGSAATDRITNSTIADNSVDVAAGPAPAAGGGGIAAYDTALDLKLTPTVAGNSSTAGAGEAGGGGLYSVDGSNATFVATILSANTAANGPDCYGEFHADGYDLIATPAACLATGSPTNIMHVSAHLSRLSANGGPTKTMTPGPHSPVLNQVPKGTCTAVVRHDQRGIKRPQGAKCDIGAVERKP